MGKEINIILKSELSDGAKSEKTRQNEGTDGSNVEDVELTEEDKNEVAKKIAISSMAMKAVNQAVNIASKQAQWQVNRNFALNDDYIGERNLQIAKGYVDIIAQDAGTIASWTMAGAKAGPWGAVAGFAIGTGVAIGNRIMSVTRNLQDQQLRIDQMDAELSFNRQRAGFSLNSGSIGENL